MRDIADTLAFLATKTLIDGGFDLGPDRKDMRRTLSGAFEDLLNRLPEGAVPVVDPLGYVVLAKSRAVDGGWRYHVSSASRVQQSAEDAARLRAAPSDEYVYVVAEVREVQP